MYIHKHMVAIVGLLNVLAKSLAGLNCVEMLSSGVKLGVTLQLRSDIILTME